MNLSEFVSLVTSGVQVGALLFMVWAFYEGHIISKKTLDKILEAYQLQIKQSMAEVLEEVKKRGSW
jgi:hypothetical protein